MSTIIDEVNQKLKETALELERFMRFLDAMERFGTVVLGHSNFSGDCADKYFKGLQQMRQAVYEKSCRNLADCFIFTAASDGLRDLAREKLKEQFGENGQGLQYCVEQFLEDWGNLPSSWRADKEEELRKEIERKLEE